MADETRTPWLGGDACGGVLVGGVVGGVLDALTCNVAAFPLQVSLPGGDALGWTGHGGMMDAGGSSAQGAERGGCSVL